MNFGPVAILIETFQSSHGLAWIVDSVADGRKTFDHTSLMRKTHGELGKVHTNSTGFMRAGGLAGPLRSCNRYERRSWKRRAKIERFGNPRNCPKFGSFGSFGVLWPSLIATDVQINVSTASGGYKHQTHPNPKPSTHATTSSIGAKRFLAGLASQPPGHLRGRFKEHAYLEETEHWWYILVPYGSLISFDIDTLHMY